uniref:D-3-phosphoglycerate dehydrogenase n=1 Tax=Strigamia maritima TaxID=126957 RepID=T1JC31_STRMM
MACSKNEKQLKVLITDPISQCCIDILKENKIDVVYKPKLALEEILKEIPDYEILVVRASTKVTKEVINVASKLILIGRAGTGVDNVDLDCATRKGVYVMNVPGGNTISAAEHACAMMLALAREIPQACYSLKACKWDRSGFVGTEMQGKTLGVVGLGRVGREVAFRMQAFGMNTIGYDPIVTAESAKKIGFELVSLNDLWPLADFITLHVPLDAQTKHLINDEVFGKCRQGVRIVNISRGGIIDESALVRALQSNKCGGAALDVFAEEPPQNFTLIQHPKVICTPHVGANTAEAQLEVSKQMALQIVDFVNHKALTGVVNAPVSKAMSIENQPWVELSRSLGQLLAALISKEKKKEFQVNVTVYGGPTLDFLAELVRVSALTGIMGYILRQKCTIINSTLLAHEHNVKIFVDVTPTAPSHYGFDEGMIMGINEINCTESLVGFIRQKVAVLHSINNSVFESPVPLSQRLLIYSKTKTPDIVQVMNGLMKSNVVVNAMYCSKPNNEWFVVSTSSDKKTNIAEGVKPSIDELLVA